MSLDKRKLEQVFEEAEMAFWDAVASAFPEIKTGDFSPMDSARLEKAMKEAIQSWYEGNQPVGKSASQIVRNLERRVARLEKSSARPSIETSLFSVGGSSPETGKEILEVNDYDEDVREALEIAFNQGKFVGFNMEDIKLIKKAGVEIRAGRTQLIYINQDQSDYFDLDYFADKGETFTVHTEALLKSNREYDREHKDYLTNNRGTLALERTNEAYNNGPGWWEVVYKM